MYLFRKVTLNHHPTKQISALVILFVVTTSVNGYLRYPTSSSSSSSSYLPSPHRPSLPKYKPKFLSVSPATSTSTNYHHSNHHNSPSYKLTTGNINKNKLPSSGSSSFGKRIAPAASTTISHKVPWKSYTPPLVKSATGSIVRTNNKRDIIYSASNNFPFTSSTKPASLASASVSDVSLNSIYSDLPSPNNGPNKPRPSVDFEDHSSAQPSSVGGSGDSVSGDRPKNPEIPLTRKCLSCICHANTNCDSNIKCVLNEFCGPYLISLKYWIEAGKPGGEYKSCVFNTSCAEKTVQSYMAKNLVDCNGDGFIDCDDYVAIHQLGPKHCQSSQNSLTNFYTSNYWNFYQYCYHLSPEARREYPEEHSNEPSDPRRISSRVTPVAPVATTGSSGSSSSVSSGHNTGDFNNGTNRPVYDESEEEEPPRRPLRRNRPKHVPRFTVRPISPSPVPVVTPPPRTSSHSINSNNHSNGTNGNNGQVVPLSATSTTSTATSNSNNINNNNNNNNVASASDSPSFIRRTDITEYCMNCLCEANGCNRTVICDESTESYGIGSCGPFAIDFNYWLDAGQPNYPGAPNGFVKCSNDRKCSESVVRRYLTKFAADCNSDGVIDCLDYAVIHKLGPKYCKNDRIYDTNYWAKFQNCFGFDSNF